MRENIQLVLSEDTLRGWQKLDRGADSTVYRLPAGDNVAKVYVDPLSGKASLPLGQVRYYKKVTNDAANLGIPHRIGGLRVCVNPILSVNQILYPNGNSIPCAISKYIEGHKLTALPSGAAINLPGSEEIEGKLFLIDRYLNSHLGTIGISLRKINIMLSTIGGEPQYLITDLCPWIDALRPA